MAAGSAVITDGEDELSPGKYRGRDGYAPLMTELLSAGFDVEWFIVVLGDTVPNISAQKLKSLCKATGGAFVALGMKPGSRKVAIGDRTRVLGTDGDGWSEVTAGDPQLGTRYPTSKKWSEKKKSLKTFLKRLELSGLDDVEEQARMDRADRQQEAKLKLPRDGTFDWAKRIGR